MESGAAAYQRGDYEEAVGQTMEALKEAEDFGEQDLRFAMTLNVLGILYKAQARNLDAKAFVT